MSKFIDYQSNFSSGLISKKFTGNIDDDLYLNGCEELQNFLPMIQGGVSKLPGTQYIADVSQNNNVGWDIYPFVFSKTESYVMVFHLTGTSPTGATAFNDSPIRIYELDGTPCTVSYTILLPIFATNLTAHGWRMAQQGDVIFVTHIDGTFAPIQILREGSTAFRVTPYLLSLSGRPGSYVNEYEKVPYLPVNISGITLTPSATTGAISITASSSLFKSTHVGSYFKINDGAGNIGVVKITAYTSITVVSASVLVTLPGTGSYTAWEESAWSDKQGWPRTVTFFDQRTAWGGTESSPDTLWMSYIGNYYYMMATNLTGADLVDADPFDFKLSSKEVNAIMWINGERVLQVGTLGGGEFVVTGGDAGLSASSLSVQVHDHVGSDDIGALLTSFGTVFVSTDGKTLRNFRYNDSNGTYVSDNLLESSDDIVSVANYKILGSGIPTDFAGMKILKIVYQPSASTLWILSGTTSLISVTLNNQRKTIAIAKHEYTNDSGLTQILSITSIRNGDTGLDDLWMVVYRLVGTTTKVYLEKMAQVSFHPAPLKHPSNYEKHWHVNCAVRQAAGAAGDTTISGLSYLEGYALRVLADGIDIGEYTVSSGVITLTGGDSFDTEVIVGIGIASKLRTNNLDLGRNFNVAQMVKKRIDEVTLRLMCSKDGKVGKKDATTYEDIEYDSPTEYGDEFLFTNKKVNIEATPDEETYIEIVHDKATPFNLLGMKYRGVTYDA